MHNFWDDKISQAVRAYYVEKDRFLGEVLDRIDSETALMVLSDHGFTGFKRAVSINTWLVENGYMTLTREIGEVDEKHSGDLFKFVDWKNTRAYSLGFASVYVNLKGREGKGIVEENEREKLVNEIVEKLEGLTDLATGEKVITRLYRGKDVYKGEFIKNSPDIIIGFRQGYRMGWQNAIGGLTPEVFSDNLKKWDGDHIVDPSHVPGVLFTNFGIEKQDPHQVDVAPTILVMLGLEVPKEMEGEPLISIHKPK
jgi:predicted AlkP superfamily phosphohydrolase/phosphomutase